jgi:diaminopimelate decarboxylase
MNKNLPFDKDSVLKIISEFGSPVYVYDETGIQSTARDLYAAFEWANDYKNFFALKACPTPRIMKILHSEGMGFDCSSRAELEMVKRMGIQGSDVFYTSNNTPKEDFELAIEMGATVNIDDLSQVPVFIDALNGREYEKVALRYNPGSAQTGNEIIGNPIEAKYGMSLVQLVESYSMLAEAKITEFGLHTMVASNELDPSYFGVTAKLLHAAIAEIESKSSVKISFVNLGGGFGLNYKVDQSPLDLSAVSKEIETVFKDSGITIYTENGRFVTGPHGYLVTTVRYVMNKYKIYLGVDASMHNLMRPGMYGAYHHITVLGHENTNATKVYDVVGSLCENNDKFAIDRELPECSPGDIMVIHDAGAHGHAMGFNYNGLLKSPEVLLRSDGSLELLRRAETVDDYFRTIVW